MHNETKDGISVRALMSRGGALACWRADGALSSAPNEDEGWLILAARRNAIARRITREGSTEFQLKRGTVAMLRLVAGDDVHFTPRVHGLVPVFLSDAALSAILATGSAMPSRDVTCLGSDNLIAVTGYVADELLRKDAATPLLAGLLRSLIACLNEASLSPNATAKTREKTRDRQPRIHITRRKLNDLEQYVMSNIDGPIDVVDLARVAGMSAGHLCRVMKSDTGLTPYQFVVKMRIDQACELLAEGDLPLVEVALSCGFANQAHFSAAFKKTTGLTPGQYRRTASRSIEACDRQHACWTSRPTALRVESIPPTNDQERIRCTT